MQGEKSLMALPQIMTFSFLVHSNPGRTQLSVFNICLWAFQKEHSGNHPYLCDHNSDVDKVNEAEEEGIELEAE